MKPHRRIAVIYDRASTASQKNNWSRADAKRVGRRLAEKHGYEWELRQEIRSGETLEERPVMASLLRDIKAGKVGAIICQDFTRLSRDEDGIDGRIIRRVCRDNDCLIITPSKVYDFDQDADHDMADFEFLIGKIQKRANVKAMVRGLQERARQGEWMGGSVKVGYDLVFTGAFRNNHPVRELRINAEEAALVRDVFRYFEEFNATAAARKLNRAGRFKPIKSEGWRERTGKTQRRWEASDVIKMVTDPIYIGRLTWGTGNYVNSRFMRGFEGKHHYRPELQIIDQSTFDRCQRHRARLRRQPRTSNRTYPFTGILGCPFCGSHMVGNGGTRRGANFSPQYVCSGRIRGRDLCPCGKSVTEKIARTAVVPFVSQMLQDIMLNLRTALTEVACDLSGSGAGNGLEDLMRTKIADIQLQSDNLARAVAAGDIQSDQARRVSQELRERQERMESELLNVNAKRKIQDEFRTAIALLEDHTEEALYRIMEERPAVFNQLLHFIFQRGSVIVKGVGSPRWGRTGKLIEYQFTPAFKCLHHDNITTSVPISAQL